MKSICDLFKKGFSVENAGDNYGVEAANNSGLIMINQGLNYADTKALCLDVVQDELNKYKAEAFVEAKKRNDELFHRVITKLDGLKMTDEQALEEFKNPSMQFDYIEAQKAYIKAGTPELASVLSDILVKRVNESSRTLLQIALGESIQVAPKLLKSQMGTLALVFNLTHTMRPSINTHEALAKHLRNTILPVFNSGVSQKQSEFQHLNFSGCSQYAAVSKKLPEKLRSAYTGLFMKGFTEEELVKKSNGVNLKEIYPSLFTRCLNCKEKLQLNAMSEEVLNSSMNTHGASAEHQAILIKLFKDNRMNDDETQGVIVSLVPEMKDVFEYWKYSGIALLFLTSVGIVIGAQYSKLVNGQDYDLSIWI